VATVLLHSSLFATAVFLLHVFFAARFIRICPRTVLIVVV